MKLWRASGSDSNMGSVQVWASSQKAVRELYDNSYYGKKPDMVEQIDIPTDKAGLIDWLNQNFGTDNG